MPLLRPLFTTALQLTATARFAAVTLERRRADSFRTELDSEVACRLRSLLGCSRWAAASRPLRLAALSPLAVRE